MKTTSLVLFGLLTILLLNSCFKSEQDSETSIPLHFYKDFVMNERINDVRLADGAPLDLEITYRWKLADVDSFYKEFGDLVFFDSLILRRRAKEIADIETVKFKSLDSVFTNQREDYINAIRTSLQFQLGGNEAIIKEVIITDLTFPIKYTRALESISLQKKEVEQIKQQSLVDLAKSEAKKKKAESDSKIELTLAESKSKLEKLQTKTEESRRSSMLAKAETESQVSMLKAQASAQKQRIAASAELDNQSKQLALQRENVLANNQIALQDEEQRNNITLVNNKKATIQKMQLDKEQRQIEMDMELLFAKLCSDNPNYTEYLVNKELASQVEIAILPSGSELGMFENMIKKTMGSSVQ